MRGEKEALEKKVSSLEKTIMEEKEVKEAQEKAFRQKTNELEE